MRFPIMLTSSESPFGGTLILDVLGCFAARVDRDGLTFEHILFNDMPEYGRKLTFVFGQIDGMKLSRLPEYQASQLTGTR